MSEAERAKAVEGYGEAVGRLQHSAFRNLRTSIANVAIFFGVVSGWMIVTGDAEPAALVPMSVSILGGVLGAATYAVKRQPLARHLLVGAVVLALVGLAGTVIASQVSP
ncbi:hypothetical protein [Micromonospora sp. WMMD964]|uniref:hypothetical protein n=1 Tax=Micromonospora sp. WMMD964 TaxID=3016091 RepID=UPI00249A6DDA|nr:hypothetical protein [Micromonospora sp. WMMD964]WFF02532.1 hypothetical protein O7616_07185 [Micromonospora sp. WMMD964]